MPRNHSIRTVLRRQMESTPSPFIDLQSDGLLFHRKSGMFARRVFFAGRPVFVVPASSSIEFDLARAAEFARAAGWLEGGRGG